MNHCPVKREVRQPGEQIAGHHQPLPTHAVGKSAEQHEHRRSDNERGGDDSIGGRKRHLENRLKSQGGSSSAPVRESFDTWPKWKIVLQVLFGVTAGQAVVWYTGQFYALF